MTAAATTAFVLLGIAGLLTTARLIVGPTFADRVVALDTLLLVIVSGIAVHAASTGRTEYLGALVLAAIIAFVATAFAARFIETRGSEGALPRRSERPARPARGRGTHG